MYDGCIDGIWQSQIPAKFISRLGMDANTHTIGIAVGMNKGHVVRRRELPPRPSRRKGVLSQKTKAVRSLIKEVCGYFSVQTLWLTIELLLMRNESLNCWETTRISELVNLRRSAYVHDKSCLVMLVGNTPPSQEEGRGTSNEHRGS